MPWQECHPPDQVAKDLVQPGLAHLQGWGILSLFVITLATSPFFPGEVSQSAWANGELQTLALENLSKNILTVLPTLSLVQRRGWFGCRTRFGQKLLLFPVGAFSHSSVVQVPGQSWGGTGRGWGSSLWASAWLGNKNLQNSCKASILGYHWARKTLYVAVHLGWIPLTCSRPGSFRKGLCPAKVLARVKISSIRHLPVGKKLFCKFVHLEVTKRLQNANVPTLPLCRRMRSQKVEMGTRWPAGPLHLW